MGFKLPFFKSKEDAPAAAETTAAESAPTPSLPPPASPDLPSAPPPIPQAPPEASPPPSSPPQAMVPRKGDLAAALRAASVQKMAGASATQSAIFKPKVSVVMQGGPSALPPSSGNDMGGTLIGKSPFSAGKLPAPPVAGGGTLIGKAPSNLAGFQTALKAGSAALLSRDPLAGAAPPKPGVPPMLRLPQPPPQKQVEVSPGPAPKAPAVELPPDAPPTIEIPTSEIFPLLPNAIFIEGARESGALPAHVSLNTAEVFPQLSKGKVIIPLNSLMASFPPEWINANIAGYNAIEIKIPLHVLVPRLPESFISLPASQARQEVDESIQTPFSERQAVASPPIEPTHPKLVEGAESAAQPEKVEVPEPLVPRPALPPLEKLSLTDATKVVSKGFRPPSKPASASKILPSKDLEPTTPSPEPPAETPAALVEAPVEQTPPILEPVPAAVSPLSETPSPLCKLLDFPEGSEPTVPEIVEKMKSRFQLQGALVITEDGLPLAGSMPSEINTDTWSAVWPKFFRKFEPGGCAAAMGPPKSCLLLTPRGCLNIQRANGIYLLLYHGPELLSPEFEEQNRVLTREIAARLKTAAA